MRLRKHAKIPDVYVASPFSPPIFLRTQCPLNQNPWDVMTLSPPSSLPPSPPSSQVNKIGSLGIDDNPMGPMEVVERKFNVDGRKWEHHDDSGIVDKAEQPSEGTTILSSKLDAEYWYKEGVVRNSVVEHHLSQPKTYNDSSRPATKKQVFTALRPRPHREKASRSSLSFNDFYYYSGSGPHWSKSNEVNQNSGETMYKHLQNERKSDQSTLSQVVDNDFVSVKIEDAEADVDEKKSGKKRVRKPIKFRSLKSLM